METLLTCNIWGEFSFKQIYALFRFSNFIKKCINSPKYDEYCKKTSQSLTNYLIFAHLNANVLFCTRPREKRVPVSEVLFLKDQRFTRLMSIQTQSLSTSIQSRVFVSITNYKVVFVIKLL